MSKECWYLYKNNNIHIWSINNRKYVFRRPLKPKLKVNIKILYLYLHLNIRIDGDLYTDRLLEKSKIICIYNNFESYSYIIITGCRATIRPGLGETVPVLTFKHSVPVFRKILSGRPSVPESNLLFY